MTDAAQSLLMLDTLQTDEHSPSFSQQSDQSFELFDFPPSPALPTHVSSDLEIDAVGISHPNGEFQHTEDFLDEEVASAAAAKRV